MMIADPFIACTAIRGEFHLARPIIEGRSEEVDRSICGFWSSYHFYDDVVVARINDPSCITSIGDVPLDESDRSGQLEGLRVYPNPANDIVADASLFGQRAVIEVFDITGSRVHAEQVSDFAALQPLDLSREWKEGLYLVMVRGEGLAPKAARVVIKR